MQAPLTTVQFLDALKSLKGLATDYQLHKAMGWHQTTVSSYRCGKSSISSAHAIRVADELGLPRAYVLTCMEAERENNDQVAGVWRELAHRLRSAAAIILIVLGLLLPGPKAEATQAVAAVSADLTSLSGIYIMRSLLQWLAQGLRTMYPALVPA